MGMIETLRHAQARLKDFFEGAGDWDLAPEREQEIVDRLARQIVRWDLGGMFLIFAPGFIPSIATFSQTILVPLEPFIDFFGFNGTEFTGFLRKTENLQRLVDKVEELNEAKGKKNEAKGKKNEAKGKKNEAKGKK